jgi:hypothetical protein
MDYLSDDTLRFIRYLSFKFDCLREQEENPLYIDVEKAQRHYNELEKIKLEKTEALAKVMPQRPIESYVNKPKPEKIHKKDGNLSVAGVKWYTTLKEQCLPDTTEGTVTVIDGWEDGNPNSPSQVKEWLYSLGWKPCTYKYDRNKATGEEKKIEQVRYSSPSDPRKGELTDSVLKLKAKEKGIEELEGLTVATHRMSIFKALLENSTIESFNGYPKDGSDSLEISVGRVVAGAGGFTNTLRLKHRSPIVNLPKVGSPWGEEIRGCIVAPKGVPCDVCTGDGTLMGGPDTFGKTCENCQGVGTVSYTVCGADVVSLEDNTKRHYMKPLDPDYVESMDVEGFDPHMKLLVIAGKITEDDYEYFVTAKETNNQRYKTLKAMRSPAKVTNYSSLYGVGKVKLAREAGMTVKEADALITAFWDMNWSIKQVAKEAYVRTLKDGSMWVKNPVSGFFYSLRNDRDTWSTLNQGTGVFIVDSWIMHLRKTTFPSVVVSMQYHDEVLVYCKLCEEERLGKALELAMAKVNETLKLNVTIEVDHKTGGSYSAVH